MTRYTHAPGVMASELNDGEVVMLDVKLASYFGLEATGAEIWRLFAEPRSLEDVVEALLERYTVERETCQRQTQALVEDLLGRNLLIVCD